MCKRPDGHWTHIGIVSYGEGYVTYFTCILEQNPI